MIILVLTLIAVGCLGLVSMRMAIRDYRKHHPKVTVSERISFYTDHVSSRN